MSIKEKISRMDTSQRQKLGEMIRFGIVGTIATALQYAVYLVMMPIVAHAVPTCGNHALATIANTIAYAISFVFNFFASTRYTFQVKATAKRGTGFALSHAVNYGLQTLFLNIFVGMGMARQIAMIPTLGICIPINFILVRFFLKR